MKHLIRMTSGGWMMLALASACDVGDSSPAIDEGTTGDVGQSETATDGVAPRDNALCGERAAPDATPEELATYAAGDRELGAALLEALGSEQPNVLLSPLSLRLAFGQVYAGTQDEAHDEIARTFAFEELDSERAHAVLNTVSQNLESRSHEADEGTPELVVRPINRMFPDVGYEASLKDAWVSEVQASYGTCVEFLELNTDPMQALGRINGWVAEQTHDLILKLVKGLPETTALVIVNALYFKAAWATPFEAWATERASFTALSGELVDVDMMRARVLEGSYVEDAGWQAVAIPYSDPQLEMVVILPPEGGSTLGDAFSAERLEGVLAGLESSVIDLRLPKFDLLSTWGLRESLESLGMDEAFSDGSDFSPIADGMMPISEVFHDVAITIDEEGTEAAAATAVVLGEDGGFEPEPEVSVVVDRSFYLVIRDRELDSLMFLARIGDPSR